MKKNTLTTAMRAGGLFSLFALSVSAQQTFQSYNLLDRGGELLSDKTETLAWLNDKNDNTVYSVPFTEENWIMYKSDEPLVVTGSLLIPSDKRATAPRTFRLEASDDGQVWKRIASALGVTLNPREAYLIKTNANTAYRYFRLSIPEVTSGDRLEIAEWQLLGYPMPMSPGLTELKCTGEYPDNATLEHLKSDKMSDVFKQSGVGSCWIEYELDKEQAVAAYAIASTSTGNTSNNPRSWDLLASDDGQKWEFLDSRSNVNLQTAAANLQYFKLGEDLRRYDWAQTADLAQQSMIDLFWDKYGSGYYLIHAWHPNTNLWNKGFNYWWMAHAIDVFVDAYQRTKNNIYRQRAVHVYNAMISYGQKTYGRNTLQNGFFDDMEWMGLACLRADALWGSNLEKRWKEGAVQLWDWIKLGWNENHGGGIQWNDASPYSKNACSNAPAAILAARLYTETNDPEYLDWALKIWEWMNSHLLFDNGIVKDGYQNENWGWTFTYNQGTWIGACLELYKITDEQKYYDAAMRTADYVVSDWTKFSPHGILDDGEGRGDGGLFKGIFMRYLSQWILSGKLDSARQQRFTQYMLENGKSLWDTATLKPEIIFKNNWRERPERVTQASTDKESCYDASMHLSGVMLFELLDELRRNKMLPENNQNPESVANKDKTYRYYRLVLKSNAGGKDMELSRWQLFSKEQLTGLEAIPGTDKEIAIWGRTGGVTIEQNNLEPLGVQVYTVGGSLVNQWEMVAAQQTVRLPEGYYIVDVHSRKTAFRQKIYVD